MEKALECYKLSLEDVSDRLESFPEEEEDDLDELIGGLED